MLASHFQAHQQPAVFQRGVVVCVKCSRPIAVNKHSAVADEFTLSCNKCHHRGFYSKRAIEIEALPERRKKPRR